MQNKNKVILAGALIGAVTGLMAALLLTRRAEKEEKEPAIAAGGGIK